jgi:hypothetical protein
LLLFRYRGISSAKLSHSGFRGIRWCTSGSKVYESSHGADHNVDLAWQPLVLVQEQRPAIATEGSADAMGRLVDLRRSLLRLHLLRTVPGEG